MARPHLPWHRWLTVWWWRYLLGSRGWTNLRCRAAGHPPGVWWCTNYDTLEPDMRCRGCGENLG